MRDPERIHRFMEKLTDLWLDHPDLRFLQLMEFVKHGLKLEGPELGFYTEDEKTLDRIKDLLK